MTLNGYFALNSVFLPVCLASIPTVRLNFENNCMKTNKDISTKRKSCGILVSVNIRFVRIFANRSGSLNRRVSIELLFLQWISKTIA